jgi:hypothetical protein
MDRGKDLVFEAREKELRGSLTGVLSDFDADDFAEELGKRQRIEEWLFSRLKRVLGVGDLRVSRVVDEIVGLFDMDSATFDIDECVDAAEQILRDSGYYDSDDIVKYRLEEDDCVYEYGGELVWVMKSPYVTHCRACSPCCPNAGDLCAPTAVLESNCLAYCPPPDDWVVDNLALKRAPVAIYRRDGGDAGVVVWGGESDHG